MASIDAASPDLPDPVKINTPVETEAPPTEKGEVPQKRTGYRWRIAKILGAITVGIALTGEIIMRCTEESNLHNSQFHSLNHIPSQNLDAAAIQDLIKKMGISDKSDVCIMVHGGDNRYKTIDDIIAIAKNLPEGAELSFMVYRLPSEEPDDVWKHIPQLRNFRNEREFTTHTIYRKWIRNTQDETRTAHVALPKGVTHMIDILHLEGSAKRSLWGGSKENEERERMGVKTIPLHVVHVPHEISTTEAILEFVSKRTAQLGLRSDSDVAKFGRWVKYKLLD